METLYSLRNDAVHRPETMKGRDISYFYESCNDYMQLINNMVFKDGAVFDMAGSTQPIFSDGKTSKSMNAF